jgi:post-segregation antitoxin (ccd killing protein)
MRMSAPPARKRRKQERSSRPAASICDEAQARWRSENEQAIEQYNAFVERHGVFGDDLRLF